jgi:hypothetical protein
LHISICEMNLIKIDFLNFDNLKNKCECPIGESQVLIIKINVVSYELMYSPNTMGHSNLIFKLSNVINY